MYAYILTIVTNRNDAEDILQEVGVTAWQKFSEYDPQRDFVAWACGIAHFKVLESLRASRKHATLSDDLLNDLHAEMVAMADVLDRQHQALEDCLTALPPQDRALIGLRYHPGVTIKQIAKETGRTAAAIYKSLQRIHERLFDCASRKLAGEALT